MSELGSPRLLPQVLPGGLREPAPVAGIGGLLEFVAPGLLHELNNAVFKIQGHAHLAAQPGPTGLRGLGDVMKHARSAGDTLQLLRGLVPDGAGSPWLQCGVLLPQICELLDVPLRNHGLAVQFRHSSRETPCAAPVGAIVRTVLALAREVVREVPLGYRGAFVVDLVQQTPEIVVRLAVTGRPELLPFPIDLRPALVRASPWLEAAAAGATVGADGRELELRLQTGDAPLAG